MKLYDHQVKALQLSEGFDHVAYFHDMGLGKTYTGSEKMMQLGARVNLVVCQKSKIDDWYDHFESNYEQCAVFNLTVEKQLNCFMNWITAPDTAPASTIPCVGIINYDLIWRRKELLQLKDFTLLLDESSLIQNDTSKRTKFILKLQPKNVILLSGTPTGGKYETLWTQMHLLGWNISKDLYLKQYVEEEWKEDGDGNKYSVITGYKNVDRLKRKMAEHGCQFLKTDEVFDLPDQIFQKVKVPASKEYKQFHKKRIIDIEDETLVGDTTLTKMLYERQLCGQYSQDKLKAFADLVQSTEDRLIVFYNFTEELFRMQDVLLQINFNDYSKRFSVVNGKEKHLQNYEDKSNSITFIQYQAGAMGLNLQKASRMIFFTLPLSSELYEQAKKRIHRINQTKTCFYYILMCQNSIEEKIYQTLEMRKDFTEELFRKEEG